MQGLGFRAQGHTVGFVGFKHVEYGEYGTGKGRSEVRVVGLGHCDDTSIRQDTSLRSPLQQNFNSSSTKLDIQLIHSSKTLMNHAYTNKKSY